MFVISEYSVAQLGELQVADPTKQLVLGSARAGLTSGHLLQAFPAHPILQLCHRLGGEGNSPRELSFALELTPCPGVNGKHLWECSGKRGVCNKIPARCCCEVCQDLFNSCSALVVNRQVTGDARKGSLPKGKLGFSSGRE